MAIKHKSEYKHSNGFVYNKPYYVMMAILSSNKYHKHSKEILQKIEETGYIIPAKRGTNTVQRYSLSKIIDELLNKDVDISELASNVLLDFGIEESNAGENYFPYMEGILNKLIFDTAPSFEAYRFPNYRYDDENNPKELWIQIHPWTTKEVYDSYYPLITVLKEKLLNSVHKIKSWVTFERDLELYKLYLQVKANIKKGILKKAITGEKARISKSPAIQILYYSEYENIKSRFSKQKFDDGNVARLISDTQIKLDNIQLL